MFGTWRSAWSPWTPPFGARIEGLEGAHLSDADRRLLRETLAERALLVARGLELAPAEQVELTRVFGEPDIHPIESIRLEGVPELIDLHVRPAKDLPAGDASANEVVGRIAWHSDLTYTAEPSRGALLYAVEVPPEGGETGYIDTVGVYAALPEATGGPLKAAA